MRALELTQLENSEIVLDIEGIRKESKRQIKRQNAWNITITTTILFVFCCDPIMPKSSSYVM